MAKMKRNKLEKVTAIKSKVLQWENTGLPQQINLHGDAKEPWCKLI